MSNQTHWLPVESVAFTVAASGATTREALQSHFDVTAHSDNLRVRQRGWRGIWFYTDVAVQPVEENTVRLRGTIQPNLWLTGSLLVLLPLLKIVVVMSNPAQLWPLSLVFWPLLIGGMYMVLRQKQRFKQQLLNLPQIIQSMSAQSMAGQSTPGHAVQRAAATTPSTAAPQPSAR